ncbi:MAG: hypothetical protein IPO22_01190 [Anaerolineales bacterium]|nr:hypothetical protein [Anaerolineales bacterium]
MQSNNRLGCLTGTGLVAALITMIALAGFTLASGGHMFSSGDLNAQTGETVGGVTSHAQISECKACHSAPWQSDTMADRCLACHTDISEQMMNVAQLHGAISQKDPTLACRDCHFEHRGATASLTEMGDNAFPHDELGYSLKEHQLTAKNEAFVCSDCHGEDISAFASDSCQTCHNDMDIAFTQAHVLSFGTECLACHDGVDRYGDGFDHNTFAFQLVGGHTEAACTGCHLDARTIVDLQSAPQDCYSCHYQVDEHQGQFGTQCEACHTPENWEGVSFDHSLSNFPLTGAHVTINCEDCHLNDTFVGTQSSCVSCHAEPVEHLGQFGIDCVACHTTTAWIPATFTGNHTFPLDHGEQGTVSCVTCHPTNYTTYTCYGCHEHTEANIIGEHREEGISDFQNCVECHADGREGDD